MATLNINGRRVTVDDSFLNLSPDQQNATVDEIAASFGATSQAQPEQRSPEYDAGLKELSAMTLNPGAAIDNERVRKNKEWYDNLPGLAKPVVAAYDIANTFGDGATMGFGDKVSAALTSAVSNQTYDDALAKMRENTQNSRDRAGGAGTVSSIAGGVTTAGGLAKQGVTTVGRLGTAGMEGAKGVLARAAMAAPEGAAYGVADALGHDTSIGTGAVIGALGGAGGSMAADALGGIVRGASKAVRGKPNVPTTDELKAASQAAYQRADDVGLIYTPNAMGKLKASLPETMADLGYRPDLHKGATSAMEVIDGLQGQNVTLKGLEQARKAIRSGFDNSGGQFSKENNMVMKRVLDAFDSAVTKPGASDILMGNQAEGIQALQQARNLWQKSAKAEQLQYVLDKAKYRAGSTGSGGNVENATRQEVRKMLEKGKGFSADERRAMTDIVMGTPGQNLLRWIGKLSPHGNGLSLLLHTGGLYASGGSSLSLAAGGMTAKHLADKGVRKGVESLSTLIRSGGDKAALEAAQGALKSLTSNQRLAIAHTIMMLGAQSRQEQPAY